jgi:hypothetical protein
MAKNKVYKSRIHGFVEPLDWSCTYENRKKSPNIAKGFKMYFSNGNSISIQFGKGNYCELRDSSQSFGKTTNVYDDEMHGPITHSKSVEIAIFDPNDEFIDFEWDQVHGRVSMDELAFYINLTANSTREEIEKITNTTGKAFNDKNIFECLMNGMGKNEES